MTTYQTAKKKTTSKKKAPVKPAAVLETPAAPAAPETETLETAEVLKTPPVTEVDPYAPVKKKPAPAPELVTVQTVHAYRIYVHTQDVVLEPGRPKQVLNDAWIKGQIAQKILKVVD